MIIPRMLDFLYILQFMNMLVRVMMWLEFFNKLDVGKKLLQEQVNEYCFQRYVWKKCERDNSGIGPCRDCFDDIMISNLTLQAAEQQYFIKILENCL